MQATRTDIRPSRRLSGKVASLPAGAEGCRVGSPDTWGKIFYSRREVPDPAIALGG